MLHTSSGFADTPCQSAVRHRPLTWPRGVPWPLRCEWPGCRAPTASSVSRVPSWERWLMLALPTTTYSSSTIIILLCTCACAAWRCYMARSSNITAMLCTCTNTWVWIFLTAVLGWRSLLFLHDSCTSCCKRASCTHGSERRFRRGGPHHENTGDDAQHMSAGHNKLWAVGQQCARRWGNAGWPVRGLCSWRQAG